MKTINLLTLANAEVKPVNEKYTTITATNGMSIRIDAMEFLALQFWLGLLEKRNIPRRLWIGGTQFTLDNVDGVKEELYDVQYKAAVDTLRIYKEEPDYLAYEYEGKEYFQFEDKPVSLRCDASVTEFVITAAVIATPAILDVTDNDSNDQAAMLSAALDGLDFSKINVVFRRIPVRNAPLSIITLSESLELHPLLTPEEIAVQEAAAAAEKEFARDVAMSPYTDFMAGIFGCAGSLLTLNAEESEQPAA